MKTKILLILSGIIIVPFGLMVGGRVPYFLLYIYLLAFILPFCHGMLGKLYLKGSIEIPERDLVPGEEIRIDYRVQNPLSFGFARLEIENSIANRITGTKEERKVLALPSKEEAIEDITIVCRRRGIYEIGEIKVHIKDIFNLYSFEKIIATPMKLKIYPSVAPLSNVPIDSRLDHHSVSNLRSYVEGDPLRRIHWKASAKKDSWMVKNYDEEADQEVVIVLDNFVDSYEKDTDRWIEDKAVEATLSIAQHFLQRNIKVSLYYQHHKEIIELIGSNFGYVKLFMEEMVAFQPSGKDAFSFNVGEVASKINQGCTLFLVTPTLNKELGAQGIRLKMKNLNPRYIVLGDEEIDPDAWLLNKKMLKLLNGEGIPTYIINQKQDIRRVLEVKYETC